MKSHQQLRRITALTLSLTLAFGPALQTFAQVIPGGHYQPGMTQAGNGIPVVNINTPSSSGVSRNTYNQFNVQQQGLILNNNPWNAQTQLGGWIQGNPNLYGGSARVILNEVVGGNPSMLRGYIEVAGQRAEVIIANPSGISVDGAGFINAAGVTLTTGIPIFNHSGHLESYRVGGGRVAIGGDGLDASTADYTRIISRAVEINSGLWANDLTVAAGTGTFAQDGNPIQLTVEDERGKPRYAIDVASLGGMYAGKIRLIGTEAGVGVRNAGSMGASAGNIQVTADGQLINTGTLAAQGNVLLAANTVHNSTDALIAAGMATDGSFGNTGDLRVQATTVTNEGRLLSGSNTHIQAGTFTNSATTHAGNNLTVTAQAIQNENGELLTSSSLNIAADTLNNTNGLISAKTDAQIHAESITNHAGVLITGSNLNLNTSSLTGAGQILSEKDAILHISGNYTAETGNQIIADETLQLRVDGTLTNAGEILAGKEAHITASTLDNRNGGEISAGTLLVNTSNFMNRGLIDGVRTYIHTTELTNLGTGRIYGNHLAIAAQTLTNRDEGGQSAVIAARERLDLGVGTLRNLNDAIVFSAGDMSIGGSLDENHIAQGRATLVYNDGATIEALGDLGMTAIDIENRNTAYASAQTNEQKMGAALTFILASSGSRYNFDEVLVYNKQTRQLTAITASDLATKTSAEMLTYLQTLFGGSSHQYALVLPSDDYPLNIFGPSGGMDYAPTVPAYEPEIPTGNINARPETFNYGHDAPYWTLFGVSAPEPIPVHPGYNCDVDSCSLQQTQNYNAYKTEFAEWKTRNLPLYQQLNTKLASYLAHFNTAKAFHVEGYDIMQSGTVVTSSNPGQILAGGNMVLDGNLINDKSTIQAGASLVTVGNVTTLDAKSQNTTRHHGFSSYSEIVEHSYDEDERRWRNDPLNVTLPVNETTLIVATPQDHTAVSGSGTQIGNLPVVQLPGGDLIQAGAPNTSIPNNALYQLNPGAGKNYLIETDPRYANYKTWLTSDYMLSALGLNPSLIQKRMGDGFYEQQLIRDQIGQLTGYRYLAGYQSDEEQYQALMNAGVEFAQTYQLAVGVALTEAQMAQLTSDIVWLVSTEVTLPDGSVETVLVPQLYTRSSTSMVTAGGALISANNVYVTGKDSETGTPSVTLNNNATIAGREGLFVDVGYLRNQTGQLHGGDVVVQSATDIDNLGGTISGDNSITLSAARDINIASTTADGTDASGRVHGISNVGSIYLSGREITHVPQEGEERPEQESTNRGQINISAGRDIQLNAGMIVNDAFITPKETEGEQPHAATTAQVGGTTNLVAGRDIHLSTVQTEQSHLTHFNDKNWRNEENRAEVGSQIAGTGNINMIAGNTLHSRASSVTSQTGAISGAADKILIESGESYHSDGFSVARRSGSALGSSSQHNLDNYTETNQIGSTLSAEQINLGSQRDMTIQASNVVATGDVNLVSESGDIHIIAGTNTSLEYHYERSTSSGFLDGNTGGMTIGQSKTTITQTIDGTTAAASTVGSLQGNVNIVAKSGSYNQTGSDVMALTGDINVVAQDINIIEARETRREQNTFEYSQSGVTVGISSPVMGMVQTGEHMIQAADRTDDNRMKALAAAATAASAYNSVSSVMNMPGGGSPGAALSLSVGSSKAESYSLQTENTARGSTMNAGGNINLIATGNSDSDTGKERHNNTGNILIQGSQIDAGNNIALIANNQIDIRAASNTTNEFNKSSSSSWSAGISYGTSGWGASASSSKSSGSGYSHEQEYTSSTITAGNTLSVISGGDVNIIGSQIAGNTVKADIGGDLNIETLQNSSISHSENRYSGGSISVSQSGGFSGSVSAGKTQADGNYLSAQEYAGIMAGDGGFDITVAGNTDLKGGIIASTQEAVDNNKNQLTTASLTTSDILNASNYDAKGSSISMGTGGGGMAGFTKESGSDSSTTVAGISGGNITITNEEEQQQRTGQSAEETVQNINRDILTGQSANGIEKNWDINQLMDNMQAGVEITGVFGQQASQGVANFANSQQKAIIAEMNTLDTSTAEGKARYQELSGELEKWGEGGAYRVLAHTIVGGLGGDLKGALGAGSSALIADQLNDLTADLPPGVKQAVGAGVAAGLGYLTGGEAGATTAFNQDTNNRQLHRQERDLIQQLARELATNEQGEMTYDQYAYWVDVLEMAGRHMVSDQGVDDNILYFSILEQALAQDMHRPLDGSHQQIVDGMYQDFNYALNLLGEYANKPIHTANGNTLTWDGSEQKYFNATDEQRANDLIGRLPNNNGHIDPLFDDRFNELVTKLSTPHGSTQPVYIVEELVVGGAVANKVASALAGAGKLGGGRVNVTVDNSVKEITSGANSSGASGIGNSAKPGVGSGISTPNPPIVSAPGLSQDLQHSIGSVRNGGNNWFDSTIKTSSGDISIAAEIKVNGSQLELSEFTMYGVNGDISRGTMMREMLTTRAQLMQFARENGFTELRITGHRALNSSSANPGKNIDWVIPLR